MDLRGQTDLESLGKLSSDTFVKTETPNKGPESDPETEFNSALTSAVPASVEL